MTDDEVRVKLTEFEVQHPESPKGFLKAPTLEQLKPTLREQHLLSALWDMLNPSWNRRTKQRGEDDH